MQKKSRPEKVSTALNLLWIMVAIGVIVSIFYFSDSLGRFNAAGGSLGGLIFTLWFIYLVLVFLIWKIGQGRNWARITFLVLFIIGVPMTIYDYLTAALNALEIVSGIVSMILQTVALVFLFQKPSSDWFNSVKK